jgi:RNA-directed DNA polymerase
LKYLTQTEDVLRNNFFQLKTRADVAKILEVDTKTLNYYLYRRNGSENYAKVEILKKSGRVRVLNIPVSNLKLIQFKLHELLNLIYIPKSSVHGFVPNRSILTNAKAHMNYRRRTFVLNVDIKDFFPSINFGRVRGLFIAKPYEISEEAATVLAQICCVENQLPQGAPTSPVIANMICARLDTQLAEIAKRFRCTYTRYADDITFSTSLPTFPTALAKTIEGDNGLQLVVGESLRAIIQSNGFKVNQEKVRLQRPDRRQEITGLTVNKLIGVPRKHIKQVRSMLYALEKYGVERAQLEHNSKWSDKYRSPFVKKTSFLQILRGKIEYIKMIRGEDNATYLKFMLKLAQFDSSIDVNRLSKMRKNIFISYSHKDKKYLEIFRPHLSVMERERGIVAWDDTKIKPGTDWLDEIQRQLREARVALLLVTSNFLQSEFIMNRELPPLLDAARTGGLTIMWIPVEHSLYDETVLGKYQGIGDPDKPISMLRGSNKTREVVRICKIILNEFK